MNKMIYATLAAVGLAGSGGYAATRMVGNQAEDFVRSINANSGQYGFNLALQNHEKGLLQSQGVLDVAVAPECFMFGSGASEMAEDPPEIRAELHYTVHHVPVLDAKGRFEAELKLRDSDAAEWLDAGLPQTLLTMDGQASAKGRNQINFATPVIEYSDADANVRIDSISGSLGSDGTRLDVAMGVPMATLRMQDADLGRMELKDLALSAEFENLDSPVSSRSLRLSVSSLHAYSVQGDAHLEDFEALTSIEKEGGRNISRSTTSLARISRRDTGPVSDVVSTVKIEADEAAISAINKRAEDVLRLFCRIPVESYEADPNAWALALDKELKALLDGGLSLALETWQATPPQGPVNGQLELSLEPGTGPLAQRLNGTGRLKVADGLVPPPLIMQAMETGLATLENGTLGTAFELARGEVIVNGTPDPFGVDEQLAMGLIMFDGLLQSWQHEMDQGRSRVGQALLDYLEFLH